MRFTLLILLMMLAFTALPPTAQAQDTNPSFAAWLAEFRQEALASGISRQTVEAALPDFEPITRVIELDRQQPERKWTFAEYRQNVINQARINKGREMMRTHRALLEQVSARYGVPPQYIVALWGIETSYGANFGSFDIPKALATLAWEGRRAAFFRSELMHALRIIEEGHISADRMKGSWAGAMGHNQFMPSSFHNFAQDGDGNGRKDIWNNLHDVFASTANYLARSGWNTEQRWGRPVKLPAGFNAADTKLENEKAKPLTAWQQRGVTMPDGSPIPVVAGMRGWIVTPDGLEGPAYLVYDNYKVIMKWNRSTYFATSVGLIADAIATP